MINREIAVEASLVGNYLDLVELIELNADGRLATERFA